MGSFRVREEQRLRFVLLGGLALAVGACGSSAGDAGANPDATGGVGQTNLDGGSGAGGSDASGGGVSGSDANGSGAGGSDAGSSSAGASGGGDPTAFCTTLITTAANLAGRCEGGTTVIWRQVLNPTFECQHAVDAVNAGRLRFSSADAASCLSLATSATCNTATDPGQVDLGPCKTALTGAVPLGGTCRSFQIVTAFQECAGSAFCNENPQTSCTGTCTAYQPDGNPCDSLSGLRCQPGSSCVNKLCVASGAEGDACEGQTSVFCAKGLYCEGRTTTQPGVCKPRKTSGACTETSACTTNYICDATGQCSQRKAVGASCTLGANECAVLSYCNAGTCAGILPTLGQPCGRISGESVSCRDGYCDRSGTTPGVCRAKKQPGDPCTTSPVGMCSGDNGHCDPTTLKCIACDGK